MKARLLDAQHGNREIPLEKLPVLLGRGTDVGIQVLDSFASRRHCEISERDGALFLRDLGSKNGSFVNGHYATESSLRAGDTFTVGASTFVVLCESSEECRNAERTLNKRTKTTGVLLD
jgi:pSer/pThr/pTyr-binding forkhead associated (FHA) protein